MADLKTVPTTITYLEMLSKPKNLVLSPPSDTVHIERISDPPVPFYREMYDAVGRKWHWQERKQLTDAEVKEIIQDSETFIYVLRVEGRIVGFAELDFRRKPDMELKYFGLVQDCIGKGFGTYLLNWTVEKAWESDLKRLWLHTCTQDHPRALRLYEKAGFVVYKVETRTRTVPID